MADLASILISLAAGAVWILFISPLMCALFGAPLPFSLRERRMAVRNWSFTRYLWLWGVLTFGVAMFLGTGIVQYFAWQQWSYPWPRPSLGSRVLIHAAGWLTFGALWGWLTWDDTKSIQKSLR